jgi:hypothetical protein
VLIALFEPGTSGMLSRSANNIATCVAKETVGVRGADCQVI